jgi:hypothetical protein
MCFCDHEEAEGMDVFRNFSGSLSSDRCCLGRDFQRENEPNPPRVNPSSSDACEREDRAVTSGDLTLSFDTVDFSL